MAWIKFVVILCCLALLASCKSGKSDNFTGSYTGQAAVRVNRHDGSYYVPGPEETVNNVSIRLDGNIDKDLDLSLTFGDNSPVKNCKLIIRNSLFRPEGTAEGEPLTAEFHSNNANADHTCQLQQGGINSRLNFRTSTVWAKDGVMKINFDNMPQSVSEPQLVFRFEGRRQ